MADTDILIKDLPLTETVNDSDDLVTEDSSPTTHRIKASVVKNYINAEQNDELDGLKVDLDNVNSNIGSLSSKVDDATTSVSSMQTTVNSLSNDVISINSALADKVSCYKGQTVSMNLLTGGYLTNGNTEASFSIPVSTMMGTITAVNVTSLTVRQNGSYLVNGGVPSSVVFYQDGINTRILTNWSSGLGGTNNDAIGVAGSMTITFS